jgi:uracil-DNA glycosylase
MSTAAPLIPPDADLDGLRAAAARCQACDLHLTGTQTVFGEGAADAELVLLGEQPGDREDVEGRPFVGPAGRELDRALEEAGLGSVPTLRTNVVKHFKFTRRGKRRIHETPNRIEIDACLPWLRAELAVTDPRVVVALGGTAAKALLGPGFRVTKQRGELFPGPGTAVLTATVHPSSILRAGEARHAARAAFHADLEAVALLLDEGVAAVLRGATVPTLRRRAAELGVTGRSHMRKAALVSAIAARLERR